MENLLRIYVIQPDIYWENEIKNLELYDKLCDKIENPGLIIFPEMFTTGFTMNTGLFNEGANRNAISWVKKMAQAKSCAIAASIGFKAGENYTNRLLFVTETGETNFYDKRHLFSMAGENRHFTAGNERKAFEYRGWKIFPQICYDLRFPVWSRNDCNYDLIINVANWPAVREHHWNTLLKARAIENQCYVAGSNRCGQDGKGILYNGASIIIKYDGTPLADAGTIPNTVITSELDKESLNAYRKQYNFLDDADKFTVN